MPNLTLSNVPDDLYQQIQHLAEQHQQNLDEQAIALMRLGLQTAQTGNNSAQSDRREEVLRLLEQIDQNRRVNPTEFGLLDSTQLIREDRDSR